MTSTRTIILIGGGALAVIAIAGLFGTSFISQKPAQRPGDMIHDTFGQNEFRKHLQDNEEEYKAFDVKKIVLKISVEDASQQLPAKVTSQDLVSYFSDATYRRLADSGNADVAIEGYDPKAPKQNENTAMVAVTIRITDKTVVLESTVTRRGKTISSDSFEIPIKPDHVETEAIVRDSLRSMAGRINSKVIVAREYF